MSRVGVFTQLYRVEPDESIDISENPDEWLANASITDENPEIISKQAWDEFCNRHTKRAEYAYTNEETDDNSFPKRVHTFLLGFHQYKPQAHDDDYYRLNKLHVLRDKEALIDFFNFVSMATEPFVVYHSGCDNHWPRSETLLSPSRHTEDNHDLYRIASANGNTIIQRVPVELGEWETVASPDETSNAPERIPNP